MRILTIAYHRHPPIKNSILDENDTDDDILLENTDDNYDNKEEW